MKKFEILQELPKCDTETRSEHWTCVLAVVGESHMRGQPGQKRNGKRTGVGGGSSSDGIFIVHQDCLGSENEGQV